MNSGCVSSMIVLRFTMSSECGIEVMGVNVGVLSQRFFNVIEVCLE